MDDYRADLQEGKPFEIKVSGWKARQEGAKRRMTQGQTQADKDEIAAIRKRHYERQAQAEQKQESAVEPEQEVEGDSAEGATEEVEMSREEMIAELKAAGQTVGPNIKDETLAQRVEALYAE